MSRLFLLLLLGCDWAGDPYHGHSPLSRPLSSQEAFCQSFASRAEIDAEFVQAPLVQPSPFAHEHALPAAKPQTGSLTNPSSCLGGAKRVYVLMSLRR